MCVCVYIYIHASKLNFLLYQVPTAENNLLPEQTNGNCKSQNGKSQ